MTPKEKAIELFKQYYSYLKANLMNDEEALEDAKVCALIAVDMMIEETRNKFWYDVKHELEKL